MFKEAIFMDEKSVLAKYTLHPHVVIFQTADAVFTVNSLSTAILWAGIFAKL